MIRPAAGDAGGRGAAPGRNRRTTGPRPRPRGVRRALLRAAAVLALLPALSATGATGAAAAPSAEAAVAEPAVTPVADTTDPARPVQIVVSRLEPRSITPDATITVAGTLTNTGNQPISDLIVRLQRGHAVNTRAELAALGRDPDPSSAVTAPFQPIQGRLGSGDSLSFSYSVPAAQLQLAQAGVYPALLNVNGIVGGQTTQRVGELSTYLIGQPSAPSAHTTVAWLWPLVDRTHLTPSGTFADDDLAKEIASGGRLDRALAAVERLPHAPPTAGAAPPPPVVPVTLAVDPALIEELVTMAAGPYQVAGQGNGKGTDAARSFLSRLRAVAAGHDVVTLPYGDVDAESLVPAGLQSVVVRSLPGSPATGNGAGSGTGDAAGAGGTPTPAPTTSAPSGAAGPTGSGSAADDGAAPSGPGASGASSAAGERIVAAALGRDGRTDLAWLPPGTLHAETLDTLRSGGIDQVVVGGAALTDGQAALGLTGGPTTDSTSIRLPSGALPALVGDTELGDLAGSSAHTSGGARLAEQRYLAVLAVLALQSPGHAATGQTLLITPPREVDPDPTTVATMMADTGSLPWLRTASIAQLAGGPVGEAGSLAAPVPSTGLDPLGLADVAGAVEVRNDLLGALVDPADIAPYDAAIARATSVSWRGHPKQFRAAAADLRRGIGKVRQQVTLLAPSDGTYSLASSDAPLVLTVRNDLPFPVRVRLQLRTRGNVGLSVGDIGIQQLAPRSRTTLQVPAQLRQSGRFVVSAALTTPDGGPLGDRVQFQVRSTAYGSVTMAITIGAAALLALLFLRRLVRFLLRRRTARPGTVPPGPAAEGAASPPPTRSPV